jgi:hypothetical protein
MKMNFKGLFAALLVIAFVSLSLAPVAESIHSMDIYKEEHMDTFATPLDHDVMGEEIFASFTTASDVTNLTDVLYLTRWNTTANSWDHYVKNGVGGEPNFNLLYGEGYFTYNTGEMTLSVHTTEFAFMVDYEVQEGLNLVANPWPIPVPASVFTASYIEYPSPNPHILYVSNVSAGIPTEKYLPQMPFHADSVDFFIPAMGAVWIYVTAVTNITYGGGD